MENTIMKMKQEILAKRVASETILALKKDGQFTQIQIFIKETIENFKEEGKETAILEFKDWLKKEGIEIEE